MFLAFGLHELADALSLCRTKEQFLWQHPIAYAAQIVSPAVNDGMTVRAAQTPITRWAFSDEVQLVRRLLNALDGFG